MQLIIIKMQSRNTKALQVQEVLTKHGCDITVRLGIHEQGDGVCSPEGVIVLQVKPESKAVKSLLADLKAVGGLKIKDLSI
ncbi:MAG: hypothetical protein HGA76_08800 [Candidatus Firestonebacteria bacterium]|nr:hypothetical protein [Candidatus Firestonebacteria bacterium]